MSPTSARAITGKGGQAAISVRGPNVFIAFRIRVESYAAGSHGTGRAAGRAKSTFRADPDDPGNSIIPHESLQIPDVERRREAERDRDRGAPVRD